MAQEIYQCPKCTEGLVSREEGESAWACVDCDEEFGFGQEPDFMPSKIDAAVERAVLKHVPDMIRATLASTGDDRLEIDRMMDQVEATEAEVEAATAQAVQNRMDVGQSRNVALLNAKQQEGKELTPDKYELPWHVRRWKEFDAGTNKEGEKEHRYQASHFLVTPGFKEAFRRIVEERDLDHEAAYLAACTELKVEPGELRKGRWAKALSEMPKEARGGYLKGREEAEQAAQRAAMEENRLLAELASGTPAARGGSLTEGSGPRSIAEGITDADLDELEAKAEAKQR